MSALSSNGYHPYDVTPTFYDLDNIGFSLYNDYIVFPQDGLILPILQYTIFSFPSNYEDRSLSFTLRNEEDTSSFGTQWYVSKNITTVIQPGLPIPVTKNQKIRLVRYNNASVPAIANCWIKYFFSYV